MISTWVYLFEFRCKRHFVEWKHFSDKEVLSTAVSKQGHADCILGHERTHHYWLYWKKSKYKNCFLLPTHWAKFTLNISCTHSRNICIVLFLVRVVFQFYSPSFSCMVMFKITSNTINFLNDLYSAKLFLLRIIAIRSLLRIIIGYFETL